MNNPMQNQGDKDQQKSGNQDQKPGQQQGGQNQTPGQQTQKPGQGGQQGGAERQSPASRIPLRSEYAGLNSGERPRFRGAFLFALAALDASTRSLAHALLAHPACQGIRVLKKNPLKKPSPPTQNPD